MTLLRKILILLEQERYIQKAYSLERPPKGLLFLKANRNSVLKAWEMAKKIAQQNPHSLAPITIEDFSNTQSGKIAEYVEKYLKRYYKGLKFGILLDYDLDEDINIIRVFVKGIDLDKQLQIEEKLDKMINSKFENASLHNIVIVEG